MSACRLTAGILASAIALAAPIPASADALACFQQPEPVCLETEYRAALEGAKPLDQLFSLGGLAKLKAEKYGASAVAADLAALRQIADGIEDRHDRSVAFDILGGVLADVGETDKAAEAFAIVRSLEDPTDSIISRDIAPDQKIGQLGEFADLRRNRGDLAGAAAALAKAEQVANAIPDVYERSWALLIVADRYILADETATALAILQRAKSAAQATAVVERRGQALLSIASGQIKAGDPDGARETLALAIDAYQSVNDAATKRTLAGSIALQFMLLPSE